MSTAGRNFINEGILRIALFLIFASLTYTVRNYVWAIIVLTVVALYALVTGIIKLTRSDSEVLERR
ncbi:MULTISPECIES: hypothetical protein [unclassified Paenibacillus]|uniref:hypothetical protein n=1 Tax=unclassified Paenibacillus TaxID=185978 RepID=UPI0004F5AA4E|nr:hypothetical protein [Paenibacillus sp. FSL H7-0357]AIQ19027.1 hypothetical protein H70357_21675 [Paenibacillus sp. FSL H7-0357]